MKYFRFLLFSYNCVCISISNNGYWMSYVKLKFSEDCQDIQCQTFVMMFRVSLGLVLYHSLLCLLLIRVKHSGQPRAAIQNSLWGFKTVLLPLILIGTCFTPPSALYNYWIPALIGSILFILLQCLLFISAAHDAMEKLHSKYENGGRFAGFWKSCVM